MNRFALIGKNIAHSKSPEIYRRLISPSIQYDLLDYPSSSAIPKLNDLFRLYDGINITSPYKEHFLSQAKLSEKAQNIGAINCLKKSDDGFCGENTDYYAVVEGFNSLLKKYGKLKVSILGDGVMSRVAQLALKDSAQAATVYSRRLTENFSRINLEKDSSDISTRPLVINACSRDFVFEGNLSPNTVFWDFNYNFTPHSSSIPAKVHQYLDGYEMLERQAFYAVAFWSSRKLF